eukprot:2455540-Pleurochrysis_carterae.AAC.1
MELNVERPTSLNDAHRPNDPYWPHHECCTVFAMSTSAAKTEVFGRHSQHRERSWQQERRVSSVQRERQQRRQMHRMAGINKA